MGFIPVGTVVAGHGLNGTVKFRYYNEDKDKFYRYASLIISKDGSLTELKPTDVRFRNGFFYLKFEGLDSPEKISFLINQELCVREEDLPPLDSDEYYDYQLIGLRAINMKNKDMGSVEEVIHTAVNEIMVVRGKELLFVPMVEGIIIDIDLKNCRITVDDDKLTV